MPAFDVAMGQGPYGGGWLTADSPQYQDLLARHRDRQANSYDSGSDGFVKLGWTPAMDYSALGFEGVPFDYSPEIANSGGGDPYTMTPELRDFLARGGYQPAYMRTRDTDHHGVAQGGRVLPNTARSTNTNDRGFMNAALLAGAVTGANLFQAAGGFGAGAGAGGAAEAASGVIPEAAARGGVGLMDGLLPAAEAASGAGSATKAALFGAEGYGAGLTGVQTSVYDAALAATGSKAAADVAATGGGWLQSAVGALTGSGGSGLVGQLTGGSSVLRDILGLVGAGVEQWNLERLARENREWADKRDAQRRRRQAPVDTNIFGRARAAGGADAAA